MLFDCILGPSDQEVQVSSHITLNDWWGDRLPRNGGGEQRQVGQASEDRKPPHQGSNMKHWGQGMGTTFFGGGGGGRPLFIFVPSCG